MSSRIDPIRARYGSRTALLRHVQHVALAHLGCYRAWQVFDPARVTRLVFVCHGNICRSAYAEQRALQSGMAAQSYGLAAKDGTPPPQEALRAAQRRGVGLAGHRARNIAHWRGAPTDLVVAMEPEQARRLSAAVAASGAQLTLAGTWSGETRPYLQDPYSLSPDYFDTCFALLDGAVAGLGRQLRGAGRL